MAAVTAALAMAVVVAVALTAIAIAWLDPGTVRERLDVIKISLAVVAGIGGVVALVVAYRRQHVAEAGEEREQTRLFNERFDTATEKLGHDSAAVRLAGVHALSTLADDWAEGRQTCIDVLCAYLRMSPGPAPDPDSDPGGRADWDAMSEARSTIMRLLTGHLRRDAPLPWHGYDFDFTGVEFGADTDFHDTVFSGGKVRFEDTEFSEIEALFYDAEFSGGDVSFTGATFPSGHVNFERAQFSGSRISFDRAEFSGAQVSFTNAIFSGGLVDFSLVNDWSNPPLGLPERPSEFVLLPGKMH